MYTEGVIEFLGQVPFMRSLPSLSLSKIAEVVVVRQFECGECVVLEGETGADIYFIWEGEAKICASVNAVDENHFEFLLKRYDYFGHGSPTLGHQGNVIALSKLTCLVLPHEHCHWTRPKSYWSADKTYDKCSPIENILQLTLVEVNIFQGLTLPDAPEFGHVFGGQLVGQALAAAYKTVDCLKVVHSLHSYFLIAGDLKIPTIYEVHNIRDGKSFATRQVNARQQGKVIFTLLASFQKAEEGFNHQQASMPPVPRPDVLLSVEELGARNVIDPCLSEHHQDQLAAGKFFPWPIEIRFCEPVNRTHQIKTVHSLRYWFRARGELSDDQALHRCVAAYVSDLIFLGVSLKPHRTKDYKSIGVSIDHTVWFHRNFRADDWLLYVITSPTASGRRGFVSGQIFNRKGELVVSATQEGMLKKISKPVAAITSKL